MPGQRCPSGGGPCGGGRERERFRPEKARQGVVRCCRPTSIPWYTSHVDGPGLEQCKMPVFSPSGPIWRALRCDFGHFWLKAGRTFSDSVGRGWQTERCQRVKNTWYGPPLGGLSPLKQWWSPLTEPRTQMPGQRCHSGRVYMGAEDRGFGLEGKTRGVRCCRPTSIFATPPTWMHQTWSEANCLYFHRQGSYGWL